jgi:glutamate/tyrosine decarboxylase-like PLP-dependent enzyme
LTLQNDQQQLNTILEAAQTAAREFLASLPTRSAGRVIEPLPHDNLPEEGIGAQAALTTFRAKYEALLAASPGPRYLGFVTGGTTPAALVDDWLVSSYDQNVVNDGDSIATTVERETLALRSLFDLPDSFEGAFVTGATQANFVALATARQWAADRLGIDVSEQGLWHVPHIPVLGGSPHASIIKALSMLGMGRQVMEHLPNVWSMAAR